MPETPDPPKLHVDSDWKAQAQAEKERLARQESERTPKEGRPKGELPPADFRSLVGILASQAMSGLGIYGDDKGRMVVDPIGAKFAIDLLVVLQEKSKGNLDAEEQTELDGTIRELQVRFVQIVEMLARQGSAPPAVAKAVERPLPGAPGGAVPGAGSGASKLIIP